MYFFNKSKPRLLIIGVLLIVFLSACNQNTIDVDEKELEIVMEENTEVLKPEAEETEVQVAFLDHLNDQELKYIESMRAQEGLVVTIRKSGPVYRVDDNGQADGFHYNLVRYFADQIDLPLKLNTVRFSEYFEHNGEIPENIKTDNSIAFTPDVLLNSHMISDNLTIIEWRNKLMSFVEIIPVSIVVITTDDLVLETKEDLRGLRVAIETNTTYYTEVSALNEQMDLGLEVIPVGSGEVAIDFILNGEADFTLKDSNAALYEAKQEPRLNVNISISEAEYIGWAVAKDNQVMQGILEKFIKYALDNGQLDLYWEKEYGVPLRIYSELLGVFEYQTTD